VLCSQEETFEFAVEDKLVFPSNFIILQIIFLSKTQRVTKGLSYFRPMSGIFTGRFEISIDIYFSNLQSYPLPLPFGCFSFDPTRTVLLVFFILFLQA